jgi:hypothetical protein
MKPKRGLYRAPIPDIDATHDELQALGWRVFVLPKGITDRRSFFEAVRSSLPLDPPVLGDQKWDALSDSLWSGLDRLETDRIALIWPASTTMAEAAPDEFEIARVILENIAGSLGDPEDTAGKPKQFMALLS